MDLSKTITGQYAKEASYEDKVKDEQGITNPDLHQRISNDTGSYKLSINSTDYYRSKLNYFHDDKDNPDELP